MALTKTITNCKNYHYFKINEGNGIYLDTEIHIHITLELENILSKNILYIAGSYYSYLKLGQSY